MIRIIIKYSFHFTLPLLILTLLMKFGFINEYLNTDDDEVETEFNFYLKN